MNQNTKTPILGLSLLKLFTLPLIFGIATLLRAELNPTSEAWIEETLAAMTLEEKVAMCHGQSTFSSAGVPRLGIPEIWMSDGPHGIRAEIEWGSWSYAGWTDDECTVFPALTSLASTFNPDLAREYGVAIGEEARYRKKDVLLAPGVNIYRTPLNGRNFEYMGEDPLLASRMCVPYIQGVQSNGVAACVKHFALNNQEQWRGFIDVHVSDRALREIYLPAFKAAVTEGQAWSLMGAYNKYQGEHCCHNQVLLNEILKTEWGFDGVVISDWGGVHDTAEAALKGVDIEMGTPTNGIEKYDEIPNQHFFLAQPFIDQLQEGSLPESIVDEKVRRILRLELRTAMNRDKPLGRKVCEDHSAVARKVAREGIVMLKNANQFFPINPDNPLTIAVIGENATRRMSIGGGSSELKAAYEISPLDGIRERFKNATILYATGYAAKDYEGKYRMAQKLDRQSRSREAVAIAQEADVVLFVGGLNKDPGQDSEEHDRAELGLPFGQDALIRKILDVNEHVGVLLVSGNAVEMPWIDEVKGIMQVWYSGSEGGHAIADLVSGDYSPSGKLPFTFPKKIEDSPAHAMGELAYPGDGVKQVYEEGILVGYRWYDAKAIEPLFPFGFGLSYTSFSIADIEAAQDQVGEEATVLVRCSVRNTGNCTGSEVVQVYIGKPDSTIERAPRELKGFAKVALEPGEATDVEIPIRIRDLAYYDEAAAAWKVEPGTYRINVGNASDRFFGSAEITVD